MRYILFTTYVDYYILIKKLLENIVKKKEKKILPKTHTRIS